MLFEKSKKFLIVSLCTLTLGSCISEKNILNRVIPKSLNTTSFLSIPIDSSNTTGALQTNDGRSDWKFNLKTPSLESGKQYPLFILLHGGVASKNYLKFSNCLVAPALNSMNGFIFSPSGAWRTWSMSYLEKRIDDFIILAKKHWPIDPQKIVLIGYSNGAMAGWERAQQLNQPFSAYILMGSDGKSKQIITTPTYVIQGTDDHFFSFKKVEKRIHKAKLEGSNLTLKKAQNKTHIKACDYVTELKSAGTWLEESVWN
ncbi:dienelactone hydrolase family protein [Aquimarina intermedia]|uniref:Dienelactone hydrolase family protein n=1 Tax=Aquimarina intermedia TaxID=350814 RepID=A0A5S5BWA1_9FLAO|nr:dienelactone hydrolase family protein [Aquimarina intermedia]TYP70430.1 dienelactone hydrolase family protein [Aquimarina intermedia]